MVVYRVLAVAGFAYLGAANLAYPAPSNNDFAKLTSSAYEPLAPAPTYSRIRAQHLIELRQAVNDLCDAIGAPPQYIASDRQLSSLQRLTVQAAHFSSLMTRVNAIRTNPLLGMPAAAFSEMPAAGSPAKLVHLQSLRDALK